jgi:hypothetical protein
MSKDPSSTLTDLRRIAQVMDDFIEIPGTKFRIGLDGIVGLIPVVGDLFGVLVALYGVTLAARSGVSASVLTRMMMNIGIEAAVGTIPVVGDLFDFVWKANRRNLRLVESYHLNPHIARQRSIAWIATFSGAIALSAVGLFVLMVMILYWIILAIGGLF